MFVQLLLRKAFARKRQLRIGTVEACKLRMSGGATPGGICFKTVCEAAVTWRWRGIDAGVRLKVNFHNREAH